MSTTPTATTSATTCSARSPTAWPSPRGPAAVRPPVWAGTSSFSCFPSTTPTTPALSSRSCAPWRSRPRYAPTTVSTRCDPRPAPASPSTTGCSARSPRCSTTPTSPCTTPSSSAAATGPTTRPCGCPATRGRIMIDQAMACAVCTYALNAIDDNGQITFEHPVVADSGHAPVPVPADQLHDVCRRCHLCSTQAPVWMYRTPQIEALSYGGTQQITQTYSTHWNACYPCAQLIDQDDSDDLTRRSIAVMGWRPTDPRAQILAGIHRTMVLTREPGRTLLTTSRWSPAHLKAGTLPKVRDRLAGLLRGAVRLPAPLHGAELRGLVADGLDQARLYWIDPQFTTLVAEVLADLPDTAITDRIVPTGGGLLAWPTPVGQHQIAAASWTSRQDGWPIVCYRSVGSDLPTDLMESLRHEIGWLIPVHAVRVPRRTVVNGGDPLAEV